jgi:hypothetical protein
MQRFPAGNGREAAFAVQPFTRSEGLTNMVPVLPKLVAITPPGAIVDDASLTTQSVDTQGFGFARIFVFLGATDIAMAALKVQESDNDSDYSDVTGLVCGTSYKDTGVASALPSATDDNKFVVFDVDLRGRKRYLDLVATCGNGSNGTYVCAWAELYRGENVPATAAQAGISQRLAVPTFA